MPLNYKNQSQLPKIIVPCRITRGFIQSHPEWNFLYGNDICERGNGGQAYDCKYELNTFLVPTLFRFCSSPSLFSDSSTSDLKTILDYISKIPTDKPIIPLPKIGRGCSRLAEFAPRLYKILTSEIDKIKYPNIEINYHAT